MISQFISFSCYFYLKFHNKQVRDKIELKLPSWFYIRKQTKLPNTSHILMPVFFGFHSPNKSCVKFLGNFNQIRQTEDLK